MRIFDKNFRPHIMRYLLQCLLATAAFIVVLLVLDVRVHPAAVGALGASTCIAFTLPLMHVAQPRYLIGGYFVGVVVGVAMSLLHGALLEHWPGLITTDTGFDASLVLMCGLTVGTTIFVMVITDTEHPPAAGVAVGLVVNEWNILTIIVILGAVAALCGLKRLLRPLLRNLL